MEAEKNGPESKKFKLHIDSNLIKSNTSILPDELKDLGVCAYDENDFERGVLLQVDCQIAEYELNKAKSKLDNNQIDSDLANTHNHGNDASNSNDSTSDSSSGSKRKLDGCSSGLFQKKARLESVLNDYSHYLNDDDQSSNAKLI